MADPFTLTAITMGATAIGGGIAAAGALGQGQAQAGVAGYQAGLAQINKQVDLQNASWSLESGGLEALKSGQKTGFQVATIKADQSGSGLDVNSGSAKAVRDSQLKIGELDQTIIATSSARRAYGFQVQAAEKDAESTMDLTAADNAKKAGTLSAITSILGAASSVSSKWSQASTAGIGSSAGDTEFEANLIGA